MCEHFNTDSCNCQPLLISGKSITAPDYLQAFIERRERCERIGGFFMRVNPAKAERISYCGKELIFDDDGSLLWGNFCRVRLCPMCTWRRTRKLHGQMLRIFADLGDEYEYIFLTLTIRSCPLSELRSALRDMSDAWARFRKLDEIKKVMRGYYRGVEVTIDTDERITPKRYKRAAEYYDRCGLGVGDRNPNYGNAHPHYHVLIAVNKSYFTSRDYIRASRWRELWTDAARLDYVPQVNVKGVHSGERSRNAAAREVAKYAVKDEEIADVNTLGELDLQLAGMRFVCLGGVIREAHRRMNLSDPESPLPDAVGSALDPNTLVGWFMQVGAIEYSSSPAFVQEWIDWEISRNVAETQRKKLAYLSPKVHI